MRILTIADFCYPGVTGGASIVIYEVMRRLAYRGHQIAFLTRRGQGTPSIIEGMEVYDYPVARSEALYPLSILRCYSAVRSLFDTYDFDLINIHHPYSGIVGEFIRKSVPRVPSVFYFHGPWYKEAMANKPAAQSSAPRFLFRKWVDRYILKNCTTAVVLSNYMKKEAESIYPPVSGNIHKIPGGVDIDRFVPVRDRVALRNNLDIPVEKRIILSVRRLEPRMGLENLIRAMSDIEKKCNDVVLVIGGNGSLKAPLERLVTELNLKNVRLIGYIADADLPLYYQASDLFIMPSLTLEGFGLSTLESLACGVPVLGTPSGGTVEILSRLDKRYILKGFQPKDIADGILNYLNVLDEKKDNQCRIYAEQFSWDNITDSVERLFESVILASTK